MKEHSEMFRFEILAQLTSVLTVEDEERIHIDDVVIFTSLIFEKAMPDLRKEEEPRFGDFSRRSC